MAIHSASTRISNQIYRLTLAPTNHFEFSQFLVVGNKTCLIHAGKAQLFAHLEGLVETILAGKPLDYLVFSHVEADENGAANQWLTKYPTAMVACNKVANISLEDCLIRPARVLKDGEVLDLGTSQLRLINTPHFPHNWDAHMWYETNEKILFSSDFCCQGGICPPIVETDISQEIIDFYVKGAFTPYGKTTNDCVDKLSALPLNAIAPMHGSVIVGPACGSILHKVKADLRQRSQLITILTDNDRDRCWS